MLSSSDIDWFDEEEADRAVFFIEEYCRHVCGPDTGRALRLAPWQRDLVRRLFGCKDASGQRRYRYLWLEVPRKSGKSTLAAAIALYLLFVDPEPAAEIVVAASSLTQALIPFDYARRMVEFDFDLLHACRANRRCITYKDARFRPLSSRHDVIAGCNASCVIIDEAQSQTNRALHDLLAASTAGRGQPLTLYLASAGCNRASLAWHLHDYAVKVQTGAIADRAWLVHICAGADDDDWSDPEVWRRVHPGLGRTVSEAFLTLECERAKATPAYAETFRRFYLNIWTDSTARWLDMGKWDRCGVPPVSYRELAGRRCRAGLDLSSSTDLTALVLAFRDDDGGYTILPFAFCPSETIRERSRRDKVDYQLWREQGHLIATPGNTIDQQTIRRKILELSKLFVIEELAYDRWNASILISHLIDDGVTCVPTAQVAAFMNAPARELERALAEGTLRHGGHPVLRWCAGNAVVAMNDAGEIRPAKNKSIERIDLMSATLMALSRHVYNPGPLLRRRRPRTPGADTSARRPRRAAGGYS